MRDLDCTNRAYLTTKFDDIARRGACECCSPEDLSRFEVADSIESIYDNCALCSVSDRIIDCPLYTAITKDSIRRELALAKAIRPRYVPISDIIHRIQKHHYRASVVCTIEKRYDYEKVISFFALAIYSGLIRIRRREVLYVSLNDFLFFHSLLMLKERKRAIIHIIGGNEVDSVEGWNRYRRSSGGLCYGDIK